MERQLSVTFFQKVKVIDEDKDGIEVLLWKGATVSDLMENKSYTFRSLSMNKSSKYGKQLYSTDETHVEV